MSKPVPLTDALERMLAAIHSVTGTDTVALSQLHRRILAADIVAPLDVPPADNSAMDGYALRAADCTAAGTELPVSQRITAGLAPRPLQPGTAARIFTGGEIPAGADTVVMQENCEARDASVLITSAPAVGDNIRRRGQDIRAGHTVLSRGTCLRAQEIGLLASLGLTAAEVQAPLQVAVLTTGNELVEPGTALQAGQIYNSNAPLLDALLADAGCTVTSNLMVADDLAATRRALQKAAAEADLIISCGGVSVGEEDHLKAALEEVGRLDLWRIAIKPGKPVAFGEVDGTPFLGLPGNPASVFVTFLLIAVPLIRRCQGRSDSRFDGVPVPARFEKTRVQSRTEYLRARLTPQGAEIYPNQSSGVLSSACWGDGLLEWPAGTAVTEGMLLRFYPYSSFL